MSKLKSVVQKFPMRRETYFALKLPTLRRILKLEVINEAPFIWVLCQADNGIVWGHEDVPITMLCEGQKLDSDITELSYLGSLTFREEDHQYQTCHYFTRKELRSYGPRKRDLGSGEEHRLRVA